MDVSKVQNQLKHIERGGLLANHLAGRKRVYTCNPRYAFLDETRGLLAKALQMLPEAKHNEQAMQRPRRNGKTL